MEQDDSTLRIPDSLTALVQADLEPLSLAELETRIAVLEQEIGRTRRREERAALEHATADALS